VFWESKPLSFETKALWLTLSELEKYIAGIVRQLSSGKIHSGLTNNNNQIPKKNQHVTSLKQKNWPLLSADFVNSPL